MDDVLIGISTSGNSQNVINTLKLAKELECNTTGLSAKDGGKINSICDINFILLSDNTLKIQDMHMLFGHTICQIVDNELS